MAKPKSPTIPQVTDFQTRVYALLQQIPCGKVTTYASIAKALSSSPRAVGGALRNNPFAPEVPCHRCIASTGVSVSIFMTCSFGEEADLLMSSKYLGGFKGDWEDAPSGQNQQSKLKLLAGEGVEFDDGGMLLDRKLLWSDFEV
jgi:methylated-DNA-[protein]-cysteine S-methyltransferase